MFRKSKQAGVWGWWAKECVEVCEQIGCQLESAGDMVDGLLGIVAHDERIRSVSQSTVGAQFVQTAYPCSHEVTIIDDKHDFSFLTNSTPAGGTRFARKYTSSARSSDLFKGLVYPQKTSAQIRTGGREQVCTNEGKSKKVIIQAHHPNFDKMNPRAKLVALCEPCHLRADSEHNLQVKRQQAREAEIEAGQMMLPGFGKKVHRRNKTYDHE
jgi:hypothetical protein